MNSPKPQSSPSFTQRLPLILLVAALIAAALWYFRPEPQPAQGNLTGASVGGSFTLVDESGKTVTNESFAGKWRLMYFGFTYCPDICPTDMAKMAAALTIFEKKHPEAAAKLQPIFMTVDPERDTPEVVAEFTESFHPSILGLSGSKEQVETALKTFRIFAAKVDGASPDSYTYDHLAIFYLMDPAGKPVEFRAAPTSTPEELVGILEQFLV